MSLTQIIQQKVEQQFKPLHIELLNESDQHAGPSGRESHFKLTLVSELFAGKKAVARHQMLYALLAEEMKNGVHALALHLYSPDEWSGYRPDSPVCAGKH